ncbi:MAG: MSHA biogenesis protein MshK [Pseudomonadota bacterium]
MDEVVMRPLLACAVLLAAWPALQAQGLPDPTRPPAALLAPSGAQVLAGPARPQLQSVLLGRGAGARRIAVIDGQMLRQGEQFKGYHLESITDTAAVLVQGKEKLVLKLYPSASAKAGAAELH